MLALMFGSQLCMLVDCAPKAHHATHACCEAAAKKAASSSSRTAHECGRPCCIAIALPHTPELDRPAAQDARAAVAVLAVALSWLDAPVVAATHERPGETASPPAWPPRCAAGTRAPPLA
jgi:hypothetical protein